MTHICVKFSVYQVNQTKSVTWKREQKNHRINTSDLPPLSWIGIRRQADVSTVRNVAARVNNRAVNSKHILHSSVCTKNKHLNRCVQFHIYTQIKKPPLNLFKTTVTLKVTAVVQVKNYARFTSVLFSKKNYVRHNPTNKVARKLRFLYSFLFLLAPFIYYKF